ncbi:MAG: phytanoyl-CoA dioxygenase family protein [Planctomycetota bacterium]
MSQWFPNAVSPTELEIFLFDLNGFIIIRNALSPAELVEGNATMDRLQHLKPGDWFGHIHAHSYGGNDGVNFQQIYEGGPIWERMIDHPSYIEKVRTFVGGEGSFDYNHGPLFIDECFASIRAEGEAIGMHSGGQNGCARTLYRVQDRKFHAQQVNVLIAWKDIGPGDGATMVVPASHKANFPHPQYGEKSMRGNREVSSGDGMVGAIEVHLKAGDAIIFTDHIMHGSAARRNPDQRRISVYRYGVSWSRPRHPYRASQALMDRLNERACGIVDPQPQVLAPPVTTCANECHADSLVGSAR